MRQDNHHVTSCKDANLADLQQDKTSSLSSADWIKVFGLVYEYKHISHQCLCEYWLTSLPAQYVCVHLWVWIIISFMCKFTLVVMPRLAPWSSSVAAISLCPSLAARCRGVYPELVVASEYAPFARSCCTISCLPRRLEMCRGVWSSW